MNQTLTLLCSLLILGSLSCKSYHKDQKVREAIRTQSKIRAKTDTFNTPPADLDDGSGNVVDNSLLIKRIELPSEVAKYNRICLILTSQGEEDRVVKNYKLESSLPTTPDQDYTLTLGLYQEAELRFANASCDTSRTFTANKGRNIFTVPVCPPNEDDKAALGACDL